MAKKQFFQERELVFEEKPKNPKFKDLKGLTFGRLKVIGFAGKDKSGLSMWFCRCDCESVMKIHGGNLTSGHTVSCGCLHIERTKKANTTHGHSKIGNKSPEYKTWECMLQRTQNPKYKGYPDYGGRGITVCKCWLKFENFFEDMGERPKGKTLDRIENDKGYYKENCRWATLAEQANNKRNNHLITYKGQTKNVTQWAEERGMNRVTILYRLKNNWPIEKAMNQKVRKWRLCN